jgi:phage terminase small subunit
MAIDAMQWHQVVIIQRSNQSRQHCLLHKTASRCYRKKVRLIDHNEMLIDMQQGLVERYGCFVRHFPKIVHAKTDAIRSLRRQRLPRLVQYAAATKAVHPLRAINRRELRA